MVSTYFALDRPDVVIPFVKDFNGGSFLSSVQSCVQDLFIAKANVKWQGPYFKEFINKLVLDNELNGGIFLDDLYKQKLEDCPIAIFPVDVSLWPTLCDFYKRDVNRDNPKCCVSGDNSILQPDFTLISCAYFLMEWGVKHKWKDKRMF